MTKIITLHDGRVLAYGDYGHPAGTPLIHCHGSNGSQLERPYDETMLQEAEVRLLVPDRPGHGHSSPQPGRTLLDWPDDIAQLADQLDLDTFAVSGYSAGGPHAAAVAYRLPQRVTRLGLVSSLAPFERSDPFDGMPFSGRIAVWLGQHAFWLLKRTAAMQAKAISGNLERTVAQFAKTLPPRDQEILKNPGARQVLTETIAEAYQQGGDGPLDDIRVYTSPWGFRSSDIQTPTIIWQGEMDTTAVPQMGRYLAETIAQVELRLLPDEGHLALYRHWAEIVTETSR